MTVTLVPPVLGGWPDERELLEPLSEGPTFIVKRHPQRAGRLWHRPRSGYLRYAEWTDRITTVYNLWCGQSALNDWCETSEEPPLGDAVCATCEGRAAGAGQIPGPAEYRVRFTPYGTRAPAWCPGGGRNGFWVETRGGTLASPNATCLVCGWDGRLRYSGGPYSGGMGLQAHHPTDQLVRCPLHAWRQLTIVDRRLACRCGTDVVLLAELVAA